MKKLDKIRNAIFKSSAESSTPREVEKESKRICEAYLRISGAPSTYTEDHEAGLFCGSTYRTCGISNVEHNDSCSMFTFNFAVFDDHERPVKWLHVPIKMSKGDNATNYQYLV